eukprot:CAMPEP_0168526924 /NCGR_PEP_ID=MMETSP0405-20121227/12278_1 /TAXON_ID=498012 /ORGANISM="Trichosphaerium sp, Strain Am-I-7 wt" /LENGTH=384 /DNA_ID=CAMNT_0008549901 /DNA_START=19 /DNA_END=1174 /DNA_ORIENTATION=-
MEPQTQQPAQETGYNVYVTNISPKATETTVTDFFSFCGKITKIVLSKNGDELQSAVVTFQTEEASKTALLLTNALIVDRPITVSSEASAAPVETEKTVKIEVIGDDIQQKNYDAPADQRTKTSVIASLIAAGYKLGNDVIAKAKKTDEEYSISARLQQGADSIKAKAAEVDEKLGVSATAATLGNAVVSTAQELDQRYKVSENVAATTESARQAVYAGAATVAAQPGVQSGIDTLRALGAIGYSKLSEGINTVKATAGFDVTPPAPQEVHDMAPADEADKAAPVTQVSAPTGEDDKAAAPVADVAAPAQYMQKAAPVAQVSAPTGEDDKAAAPVADVAAPAQVQADSAVPAQAPAQDAAPVSAPVEAKPAVEAEKAPATDEPTA